MNETFGLSNQFIFAAGLADYWAPGTEDITDPEIGELKFYYTSWDSNIGLVQDIELKTKICESKDFYNINGTINQESNFFPTQEYSQSDLQRFGVG